MSISEMLGGAGLDEKKVSSLTDEQLRVLGSEVLQAQRDDLRENQIMYYRPVTDIAASVHSSTARYVCIGGGNGACLPLSAPVLMADSHWKALRDVEVGDKIIGVDPETRMAGPTIVSAVFRSGQKEVFRITFSDGGSFQASADHHAPLLLGSGVWTTKKNLKVARRRRLGDYLSAIPQRSPAKRISAISPRNIRFAEGKRDSRFSPYLLGALLGDGGLSGRSIKFFNKDAEVIARIRGAAAFVGDRLPQYDEISFGVVGGAVLRWVRKLGLMGCTSHTKFVPDMVLSWPTNMRREFLAGMIDTDGGVSNYSTVSPRLASGFQKVVRSLGGKASIRWHDNEYDGYFLIYWRLNERLPLCLPHKQPDNCKGREIDYTRRVCRQVESLGMAECGDLEVEHPGHCYVTEDFVVVSNSKTETMLAHMIMLATGCISTNLDPKTYDAMRGQFRGPINVRLTIQSLENTLYPVILPKLTWWRWTGLSMPGGDKGHWGWVPRRCLKQGNWEMSWRTKQRILTMLCFDPDQPDRVLGESMLQIMSHKQDPADAASGDFHLACHDELPQYALWRENEARTMRVSGRMFLAFTWPDDPAIPVDWVHDELYELGKPGPNKDEDVDWFEMWTEHNPHLDSASVEKQKAKWEGRAVGEARLYGRSIRFANRVHPLFTEQERIWCMKCGRDASAGCRCGEPSPQAYCHVQDFDTHQGLPTIQLLDPHPRKPHMALWAQVDTWDDLWIVAEASVAGGPQELEEEIARVEREFGLDVVCRVGDRNMLRSPSGAERGVTWQDEFLAVGLLYDLSDVSDVGRSRLNDYLAVDPDRRSPRIHIHPRCVGTIRQLMRYVWDDFKHPEMHDLKQKPKEKEDDFPSLLKYLLNMEPRYNSLVRGPEVLRTRAAPDLPQPARQLW